MIETFIRDLLGASRAPRRSPKPRTVLDRNLVALSKELAAASIGGRVVVLGQPGAGKSALVDELTARALTPRPTIGAFTDQTDWSRTRGVRPAKDPHGAVWLDTPGYGTTRHPFRSFQRHLKLRHVDCLIVAFSGKLRDCDQQLLTLLRRRANRDCVQPRVLLVRTQCDETSASDKRTISRELRSHGPENAIISFVSCRTGAGIDALRKAVERALANQDAQRCSLARARPKRAVAAV